MALVGYESSDEDEEVQTPPAKPSENVAENAASSSEEVPKQATESEPEPAVTTAPTPTIAEDSGIIGPMRPPEGSENLSFPPLEEAPMEDEAAVPSLPPGSPYSANRALLRDLTLPTVPNMDIPPSPPGSPPPGANKKFEHFLKLKKEGVHFNSKIAQSSALKNPSLMDKLLGFAEVSQKDQYRTTLGTDLWDPSIFPKSAYKEQLRQSQTEIAQARARSKGGPVQFVAASATSSRDTAPGSGHVPAASTGKRKTRFDS
ncbi:HCNGP-like protein-domain-containing protein [Pestalotiopsis sp. NC0098]|nr:HCNGP-like protein-domain-containing protein [Pestalotiopsis sp. NC0098]